MKNVGPLAFVAMVVAIGFQHVPGRLLGGQAGAPRTASVVGIIMDSKCATVGSHDANLKKLGAKDARECTLKCVRDGSFVLYNPDTKKVYQLNDQEKPAPFAGDRVKITGTYDDWSQTIEIESIERAAET